MVIATGFESFDVSKKSIIKESHTSYTPNQYISKNSSKLDEENEKENAIEIGNDDLDDDLDEVSTEIENELDIPAFIRKKMK